MNPLEQLKSVLCDPDGKCCIAGSDEDRAIVDRALEALAQPEQEPVAELAGVAYVDDLDLWHFYPLRETDNFPDGTKFYTTPPQRPWVGLTAQEAADCWTTSATKTWHNFETALKEKNT